MNRAFPLAPGMEIGYVIRDARKWEVDPRRQGRSFNVSVLSRAAGKGLGGGGVCIQITCNLVNRAIFRQFIVSSSAKNRSPEMSLFGTFQGFNFDDDFWFQPSRSPS